MNVPKADPGVHGILTAIGGFNSNELSLTSIGI
jgi:hypothetical protein